MAARTPPKSTGTKRTGSGAKKPRSSASSVESRPKFVVCLSNQGYGAALETRKIYRTRADARAERIGLLRVFDESGESYLYPKVRFGGVKLAPRIAKALRT